MKKPTETTVEVEAVVQGAENTTPSGPLLSIEGTERSLVALDEKPAPPSPKELHAALDVLLRLRASEASEAAVTEGKIGDVFLVYDISIRPHGMLPFRVAEQRSLLRILLPEGRPEALTDVEAELMRMIRPIKQYVLSLVNDAGEGSEIRGYRIPRVNQ